MKLTFNAYIDGFSLYKGSLESRPSFKWLNLLKFCADRRPDMELGQVYYFTAPVKSRFPGDTGMNRQDAYIRVLRDQGVNVVPGQFRKDVDWLRVATTTRSSVLSPMLPNHLGLTQMALNQISKRAIPDFPRAQVWKFGEKGSDVNLASHLLFDVLKENLKAALVITADSDFVTPIRMATQVGTDIKVVVPKVHELAKADGLRKVATYLEELHIGWLADSQLPRSYITSKGGNITRPNTWT